MNITTDILTAARPPTAGYRNIHLTAPAESPAAAPAAAPEHAARLRWMQRSPAEEFAARAGEHEPLAPEVAALILFRKERLTCGRDGLAIKVKTDGEGREVTRKYWHENSLCCSPGWLGRAVFAAYNRHAPHCLYVFTADGEFIEAVPEKGQDEWFGAAHSLEAHRRHQAHALKRLEHIHADDTGRAVAEAQANTAQILKVVQTFPAEAQPNQTDPGINPNLRPGSRVEPTRRSSPDSLARDCFARREIAPAETERAAATMDEHGRIVPRSTGSAGSLRAGSGQAARAIAAHEERITGRREEEARSRAAVRARGEALTSEDLAAFNPAAAPLQPPSKATDQTMDEYL